MSGYLHTRKPVELIDFAGSIASGAAIEIDSKHETGDVIIQDQGSEVWRGDWSAFTELLDELVLAGRWAGLRFAMRRARPELESNSEIDRAIEELVRGVLSAETGRVGNHTGNTENEATGPAQPAEITEEGQ